MPAGHSMLSRMNSLSGCPDTGDFCNVVILGAGCWAWPIEHISATLNPSAIKSDFIERSPVKAHDYSLRGLDASISADHVRSGSKAEKPQTGHKTLALTRKR